MANIVPQTVSTQTLYMQKSFSDLDMTDVATGFQEYFGRAENGGESNFLTDTLMMSQDIMRGESTVSKIYKREGGGGWDIGADSKAIKGDRWKNKTRVFPLMPEYFSVSHEETLRDRQFGKSPYEGKGSLTEIRRGLMLSRSQEAIKRMMRKNEIMCSESIRTGKQTLDDGEVYDYDRATTNTFAAALVWTNSAAEIIKEIDKLFDRLQENGKADGDHAIAGTDVFAALIEKLTIQNMADNRGYSFVRAGTHEFLPPLPSQLQWMVKAGFIYQAHLHTFAGRNIPIFTYNEKYQDDAKAWQSYMPVDQFLGGYSGARCDRSFGPRLTFDGTNDQERRVNELLGFNSFTAQMPTAMKTKGAFDPRMFHIDGRVNNDNDVISMRITTGGIYVPVRTDSFGLITGVV